LYSLHAWQKAHTACMCESGNNCGCVVRTGVPPPPPNQKKQAPPGTPVPAPPSRGRESRGR
jgi:hypothetical protein